MSANQPTYVEQKYICQASKKKQVTKIGPDLKENSLTFSAGFYAKARVGCLLILLGMHELVTLRHVS